MKITSLCPNRGKETKILPGQWKRSFLKFWEALQKPHQGAPSCLPFQSRQALHLSYFGDIRENFIYCLDHPVLYRSDLLFSLNYPIFQKLGLEAK